MTRSPICGRQTSRGAAAKANESGVAPCILPRGHDEPCDSGAAPPPPNAA